MEKMEIEVGHGSCWRPQHLRDDLGSATFVHGLELTTQLRSLGSTDVRVGSRTVVPSVPMQAEE